MTNPNEAYEKLVKSAAGTVALASCRKDVERLTDADREALAVETGAWVNTLAIEEQNVPIVWFGGQVVRKNVPDLIRKSAKFAKFWAETLKCYYNEYLSGGSK